LKKKINLQEVIEMQNAEQELQALEEKRKELKAQVAKEKAEKKAMRGQIKAERDAKIEKIDGVLRNVLKEIFAYNKLGKVAKMDIDILDKISEMVSPLEDSEVEEPKEMPESGPEGDVDADESA
jgi:hypothetical protein